MAAPQSHTDWHLHLDRDSDRCVLDRGPGVLALIGTYRSCTAGGEETICLRLSEDPPELRQLEETYDGARQPEPVSSIYQPRPNGAV